MSLPICTDFDVVTQAPFKRLRMKHRRIIALHVSGKSNPVIARMLDVAPSTVSQTLNNPAVTPILTSIYEQYDRELKALYPLAIDSMREAMESDDYTAKLRAADLYFKTQGKYNEKQENERTAENIVELILSDAGNTVKRIRYTERKFLSANVQNSDNIETIDVTPT